MRPVDRYQRPIIRAHLLPPVSDIRHPLDYH